jgi:hypothetical protein
VSAHPTPTRKDHQRFVEVEGWRLLREVDHHVTYELDLPAGGALRTRISHPVDRSDYGPSLWAHILRQQLVVTEDAFWDCVQNGVMPARGGPATEPASLPAELAWLLHNKVGLSETEVAALTKEQAIERLSRFWTEGS